MSMYMLMEYLWVIKVLPDISTWELAKSLFLSITIASLPEILFAYYFVYIGYEKLMNKASNKILVVIEILLLLALNVLLIRYLSYWITQKLIYQGQLADKNPYDLGLLFRPLIYTGFSSGLALSAKLARNQIAAKEREKNLIEEKLSTELKLLRNQLHPHFLFNTLNNIYALARKKSDMAPDAVMKLSELLNFMLYESGKNTIPLSIEINFLEDYITLQRIRYNNRLKIIYTKETDAPEKKIVPLLLLPLIENAFKHGVDESRFESYISIMIRQQQNHFHFNIENPFEKKQKNFTDGQIGLKNLQRQLELLYKDYKLDITDSSSVFRVTLYINLDSYGKV